MSISIIWPDIRLIYHLQERFTYGENRHGPIEGIRCTIIVGPASWPAIARGNNRKRIAPGKGESLLSNTEDLFVTEQAHVTLRDGSKLPAIRVLGEHSRGQHPNSRGRLYIHPANMPGQLEGCVAPGKHITKSGVARSRPALKEIFEALGRDDWKTDASETDLPRWVLRAIDET